MNAIRRALCRHPKPLRSIRAVQRVLYVNGPGSVVSYQCQRCERLRTAEVMGRSFIDILRAWGQL